MASPRNVAASFPLSRSVRFRDHEAFQRSALHMAAAGATAGLAVHVAARFWPWLLPITGPWGMAILLGAVGLGATAPEERARLVVLARLLGLTVVAGAMLWIGTALAPGIRLAFAAGCTALLVMPGRRRPVWGLAATAAAGAAGAYVLGVFTAHAPAGVPEWIVDGLAAGAFGWVTALGLLPRHLEAVSDPVMDAWRALEPQVSGEPADVARRVVALWKGIQGTLEEQVPARAAFQESALRVLDLARRWRSVGADGDLPATETLLTRLEEMERKIATAGDRVARAQYEHARVALAEQLRYAQEIGSARERVLARMHHHLAAMERLRLALLRHRSADASWVSTDVQPVLDHLASLGEDLAATSEALRALEEEEVPAAATGPAAAPATRP